ncbi:PIG-L deacetylase family protein [Paenibacillus eucommiae]|uniref:LmbE family N-acetylglucosaminyl deacetylase n=1 Tax=Paenibacillus eucommiae TaxID=1355755 RepID=A0ABS4J1K0_9BACL|nr:PIG-L deacetylase family protein [Paenibacillus eucommiae]MBP1993205.1 LmbE family N-acetylglucosaminyl deacetylase [Paenibacillus eucommiae]
MNILAIVAHPDDVEINCFGTLLKYFKQGHKIFIALTTSGNQGSNLYNREEIGAIREQEQIDAAKFLDAEIRFLRFDDQRLIDSLELRRDVINAIRWANPDVIFTHYINDVSLDHAVTGKVVTEVMLSLPGKNIMADEPPISKAPSLFFFDTDVGLNFQPEIYVDISNEMESKREAFSKHKSQNEWMENFMKDTRFDAFMEQLSAFRGLQAGFPYAEGFIGHRIHGYLPNYRLLP